MNRVIILGQLVQVEKFNFGNEGKTGAKVLLQLRERVYKDKEWQEIPMAVEVTLFGRLVEEVENAKAGAWVAIEGKVKSNPSMNQDKWYTSVIGDSVKIL